MAKTYNPKNHAVTVMGYPMSGFGDTFISVAYNADAFTTVIGADGEVSRVQSSDMSGEITLTLKQTSASNDVLSDLAIADRLLGLTTGPVFIKDIGGTTVVMASEAWIKKMPDLELGKDGSEREWVLSCGNIQMFVGGNPL
jgi:hypothetical protein